MIKILLAAFLAITLVGCISPIRQESRYTLDWTSVRWIRVAFHPTPPDEAAVDLWINQEYIATFMHLEPGVYMLDAAPSFTTREATMRLYIDPYEHLFEIPDVHQDYTGIRGEIPVGAP